MFIVVYGGNSIGQLFTYSGAVAANFLLLINPSYLFIKCFEEDVKNHKPYRKPITFNKGTSTRNMKFQLIPSDSDLEYINEYKKSMNNEMTSENELNHQINEKLQQKLNHCVYNCAILSDSDITNPTCSNEKDLDEDLDSSSNDEAEKFVPRQSLLMDTYQSDSLQSYSISKCRIGMCKFMVAFGVTLMVFTIGLEIRKNFVST